MEPRRVVETVCSGGARPWSVAAWALWLAALLVDRGGAAEVMACATAPLIDGVLSEWGAPARIPVVPGGEKVGVRGAFEGPDDHEVDLYLMWDAHALYVAVVVEDDTVDVKQVGPQEYVWEGPGGERKDRMFYYDNLKIFLRGPKESLGCNVWISPHNGLEGPYVWGSRQRSAGTRNLPVQVGSAWVPGIYTYEVALPWEWLAVHPQPGMELDARFLLPDSDLPGLALDQKIARSNKWIWWQGTIRLQGEPPGLAPPPATVVERIEEAVKARKLPTLRPGPRVGAQSPPQGDTATAAAEEEDGRDQASPPAPPSDIPTMADLRSRLADLRQAQEVPEWEGRLQVAGVTRAQAAAYVRQLAGRLQRLNNGRNSARLDVFITDMAEAAGTEKLPARAFLLELLDTVVREMAPEAGGRRRVAAAAEAAGIEEERAVKLISHICSQAKKAYEKHVIYVGKRVPTTSQLVERGARKARLSPVEARELIRILLSDWAG